MVIGDYPIVIHLEYLGSLYWNGFLVSQGWIFIPNWKEMTDSQIQYPINSLGVVFASSEPSESGLIHMHFSQLSFLSSSHRTFSKLWAILVFPFPTFWTFPMRKIMVISATTIFQNLVPITVLHYCDKDCNLKQFAEKRFYFSLQLIVHLKWKLGQKFKTKVSQMSGSDAKMKEYNRLAWFPWLALFILL